MNFRKTQIKRGCPEDGFFHRAFDANGTALFNVPVIIERVERGQVVFGCGVGGEIRSTLKEAKEAVKRMAGYR